MHNTPPPKPCIVVWTDLSYEQIGQLNELDDSESIHKFFIKIFDLEENTNRTMILCDLFYYGFHFARNNKFNHEQTSAFLSILKRVHDMCTRTPFANMEETYHYFKALILKHSLSRPPHNLRIFTPDVTKKVTDYIVDTYFRHFKMYKYAFTPSINFKLKFTYTGMSAQLPETNEVAADTAEEANTSKDNHEQEEHNVNPELIDVRRLIQMYVDEELRKIQGPIDEQEVPQKPQDKQQRPLKSGSTKNSKPQTPK